MTLKIYTLLAILLLCGSYTTSGQESDICPPNPMSSKNSLSGIIVGSLVSTEKLTSGIFNFVYYYTVDTMNQLISASAGFGNIVIVYSVKINNYLINLEDSIKNQIAGIYNGSGGALKAVLNYSVKLENELQNYVYKQSANLGDYLMNGKLTMQLSQAAKEPFNYLNKIMMKFGDWFNKVFGGLEKGSLGGIINRIKALLAAPYDSIAFYLTDIKKLLQTEGADAKQKLQAFYNRLKSGSISEMISATLASPVQSIQVLWALTIDFTESTIVATTKLSKGLMEPLIGKTLTDAVGKGFGYPLKVTVATWNSLKGIAYQLEGSLSSITGGGSLTTQINTILTRPLALTKVAWDKLLASFNASGGGNIIVKIVMWPVKETEDIWNKVKSLFTGGASLSASVGSKGKGQNGGKFSTSWSVGGVHGSASAGGGVGGLLSSIVKAPKKAVSGTVQATKQAVNKLPIVGGGSVKLNVGGKSGSKRTPRAPI